MNFLYKTLVQLEYKDFFTSDTTDQFVNWSKTGIRPKQEVKTKGEIRLKMEVGPKPEVG